MQGLPNHEEDLIADVLRRLSLRSEDEAAHVVDAVADALGELLTLDEAKLFAKCLPDRWSALLTGGALRHPPGADLQHLVAGVSWRENVPRAVALEHATAVCEAFGRLLPRELAARLQADLPDRIASLIEPRYAPPPAGRPSHEAPARPPATLATGRPGSSRPLSEARPVGHTHSVAENPDPHGETKLSSAKGLTQERLEDSIAVGRGLPRRTVSGA